MSVSRPESEPNKPLVIALLAASEYAYYGVSSKQPEEMIAELKKLEMDVRGDSSGEAVKKGETLRIIRDYQQDVLDRFEKVIDGLIDKCIRDAELPGIPLSPLREKIRGHLRKLLEQRDRVLHAEPSLVRKFHTNLRELAAKMARHAFREPIDWRQGTSDVEEDFLSELSS